MDSRLEAGLIDHLLQFVTPRKRELMASVIERRTSYLQVVLEDIFQPHNASAVMRSCECFGIQHLHVIEERYPFAVNRDVAMGSSKWIHLHRYNDPGGGNVHSCLEDLKAKGFRIVATSLDQQSRPLHELPVDRPIALCFGTEEDGLSSSLLEAAHEHVHIPMLGFTQSFNISVSAALCLYELRRRIDTEVPNWQLSTKEKHEAYRLWLRNVVRRADILEREYLRKASTA